MKDIVHAHDLTFKKYIAEDQIRQRTLEIGREISEKYKHQRPLFIGILNGAFIFAADLVRACSIDVEVTFTKLSSYDGLSSTGSVSSSLGIDKDLMGKPVIIVEDILDTGQTMHYLIPRLKAQRPASVEIASLLVKREALQYPIDISYVGFEIPDKFVIGYGLDYREVGRNLKAIYQLAE